MTDTIELSDTEINKNNLISYKTKLSELEKNNCTQVIEKMIKHYEDTSYDGNIDLKETYEYHFNNGFLTYYVETKENCNLSEETIEEYNLPIKFLAASIQVDEIYQPYYYQYELNLKDFFVRQLTEPYITNVEYNINRGMELEIISALIELSNKEVIANE